VVLRPQTLACFTVQGPQADGAVIGLHTPLTARLANDRSGLGGFDLLLPQENGPELTQELAALGPPFGLTALDLLRTEAFLPWFGMEILRGQNPMIYGSGARISHDKGCYLGQETIAMTRDRGRPPRLLTQISANFDGLPEAEAELLAGEALAGQILSGHFSPKLEKPVAFALVKTSLALPGGELRDRQNRLWTIDRVASLRESS
jgi:aminomethyltransferase